MDALEKWIIIHTVHTTPNHHPPKMDMDVLPKTYLQIILASKWLVRHSGIRPPNQQRRPLPSPLSDSCSMAQSPRNDAHDLFT